MTTVYEVTITVSPVRKGEDITMDEFFQKRSVVLVSPGENINDVLSKISDISKRKGDEYELIPFSPTNALAFIYTNDVDNTCKEVRDVVNSFENVSCMIESPEEVLMGLDLAYVKNECKTPEELIRKVFHQLIKEG